MGVGLVSRCTGGGLSRLFDYLCLNRGEVGLAAVAIREGADVSGVHDCIGGKVEIEWKDEEVTLGKSLAKCCGVKPTVYKLKGGGRVYECSICGRKEGVREEWGVIELKTMRSIEVSRKVGVSSKGGEELARRWRAVFDGIVAKNNGR